MGGWPVTLTGGATPGHTYNERECCAGTDEGLAYSAGGTCNLCIGMLYIDLTVASNRIFVQFMGLLKLCMMWMRMIDWTLTSDSM